MLVKKLTQSCDGISLIKKNVVMMKDREAA